MLDMGTAPSDSGEQHPLRTASIVKCYIQIGRHAVHHMYKVSTASRGLQQSFAERGMGRTCRPACARSAAAGSAAPGSAARPRCSCPAPSAQGAPAPGCAPPTAPAAASSSLQIIHLRQLLLREKQQIYSTVTVAISAGSASARLRTADSPSRSVRKSAHIHPTSAWVS